MTRRRCRGASQGPRRTPGAVLLGFGMARGGVTSVGAASLRLPEASVAEAPGRPGTCRDRAGVRKTFLIFLPPSPLSRHRPHPTPSLSGKAAFQGLSALGAGEGAGSQSLPPGGPPGSRWSSRTCPRGRAHGCGWCLRPLSSFQLTFE